jgi:hypothetical protein
MTWQSASDGRLSGWHSLKPWHRGHCSQHRNCPTLRRSLRHLQLCSFFQGTQALLVDENFTADS